MHILSTSESTSSSAAQACFISDGTKKPALTSSSKNESLIKLNDEKEESKHQLNSLIKKLIYFKKELKPFIIIVINGYYFKRCVTFETILSEKLDEGCGAFRK